MYTYVYSKSDTCNYCAKFDFYQKSFDLKLIFQLVTMDYGGETANSSVNTLCMERTVRFGVSVMSLTVIMSMVVYSLHRVRYIINN